MKPSEFLSLYKDNDIVQELVAVLRSTDRQMVGLTGMAGSSASVVAAAAYRSLPKPFVCILSSRESAAYFFNDIENLLDEKDLPYEQRSIFLFPSSYKKPYQTTETDNANILLRAEVINRLSAESKKFLLVTYPEALTEKVISRKVLRSNILALHTGEATSVDFVLELLLEYGFQR
ncbi:MAG: transcription-repair coupling factor, partial [Bacteroidota bacterium]